MESQLSGLAGGWGWGLVWRGLGVEHLWTSSFGSCWHAFGWGWPMWDWRLGSVGLPPPQVSPSSPGKVEEESCLF